LVIDYLLDAILERTDGEVIAVTGFAEERVREHLTNRHGDRVATAHNSRFEEDVNILSVEIGVSALQHPERGYLIVETDLLLEEAAWDRVFGAYAKPESFWLCKGYYDETLTGGIVHTNAQGWIDAVEYQPRYDPYFRGWSKMLGMLGVAPAQVAADRRHRRAAIANTVAQYYLIPWRQHLADLPCRAVQIDDCFAQSFNTVEDFTDTGKCYLDLLAAAQPLERS
jgi:hypothetical protein